MSQDQGTRGKRPERRGRVPGLAADKTDQPGLFNPNADISGGLIHKREGEFVGGSGRRARDRVAARRYGKR